MADPILPAIALPGRVDQEEYLGHRAACIYGDRRAPRIHMLYGLVTSIRKANTISGTPRRHIRSMHEAVSQRIINR